MIVKSDLLLSIVSSPSSMSTDSGVLFPPPIVSMEWGLEGYHLWMVTQQVKASTTESSDSDSHSQPDTDDNRFAEMGPSTVLMQFQFLKSALTVNPCTVRFFLRK